MEKILLLERSVMLITVESVCSSMFLIGEANFGTWCFVCAEFAL